MDRGGQGKQSESEQFSSKLLLVRGMITHTAPRWFSLKTCGVTGRLLQRCQGKTTASFWAITFSQVANTTLNACAVCGGSGKKIHVGGQCYTAPRTEKASTPKGCHFTQRWEGKRFDLSQRWRVSTLPSPKTNITTQEDLAWYEHFLVVVHIQTQF